MSRQAARLTRCRSRVGPSVIKTRPGCVLPSAAAPLTSSGARLLMRTPANYSQSDGESTLGQAMGLGGGPSAASQASRPAGALSLLGTVTLLADGAPRLGAQGRADGGSAGSSLSPSPEDTQRSHHREDGPSASQDHVACLTSGKFRRGTAGPPRAVSSPWLLGPQVRWWARAGSGPGAGGWGFWWGTEQSSVAGHSGAARECPGGAAAGRERDQEPGDRQLQSLLLLIASEGATEGPLLPALCCGLVPTPGRHGA